MEFDEFLPDAVTDIDLDIQMLNLGIASWTCAVTFYLVLVLAWWLIRLSGTGTYLRPFIFGVWLAKFAILFWALTGIYQIVWFDMTQPLVTLPSRGTMMIAVSVMAWVTTKYYKTSRNGRHTHFANKE